MWEAIESNRKRSCVLAVALAGLLLGLGAVAGAVVDPALWWAGASVAGLLFLILLATALAGGDRILLHSAGATRIDAKQQLPRLWNVVEEMTIASGLRSMPSIWLIEDSRPNAFATGRTPERAAVAVTTGLASRLKRDELQGVVAHEIGHVVNRDIRFMTLAGVMVGSIVLFAELFLRYTWYSGGGHARRRSGGGRGGDPRLQMILIGAGLLAAVLAPLFARMLYFACSRRREYLADASAARFTRYPEGLASALEKIALHHSTAGSRSWRESSRLLAPMFIVNPMRAFGSSGVFSTHPPTEKRIEVLRAMGGRADYAAYDEAFGRIHGKERHCIGEVTLAAERRTIDARPPSPLEESGDADPTARLKEVTDLLDRIGDFVAIPCPCGVGIKIPPGFDRETVPCPRCGRTHAVPQALVAATAGASRGAGGVGPDAIAAEPLQYRRRGTGWESFRCPACGKTTHLSPAFAAPQIRCSGCGRTVQILPGRPDPAGLSEADAK